jgi:2-C-methyl-D-erythritol 4-phosphate cytidylyltransferase/2-C-methyl-D-erythritol 2,4-cyclodiphosphate synthase
MTSNLPKFHILIAAAGSGSRSGLSTPKQHLRIDGKTILEHTIDIFASHSSCASINVIIGSNDPKDFKSDTIIIGSNTRKNSIYNGLKLLSHLKNEDIILTHDAARPYTHHDDINALLTAMRTHRAATLAKPVNDTLRKNDGIRIDRENLYALQTPQAFYYGDIMAAHEKFKNDDTHTDETSLISAMGGQVTFIKSQHYNEKITTSQDIMIARTLLSQTTETRIGQGFDVHAFEDASSGKPLILCGVKIPHSCALTGHSDADVGLHAITDALLGAIAQGDIGRHFPPSNPAFKNMDSAIFLEKARDLVSKASGSIINIDLTFICENPKITPHAPAMIARVAGLLQIPETRISIKATTTERLGFTGREEGIAATAIATVKVPPS